MNVLPDVQAPMMVNVHTGPFIRVGSVSLQQQDQNRHMTDVCSTRDRQHLYENRGVIQ